MLVHWREQGIPPQRTLLWIPRQTSKAAGLMIGRPTVASLAD